MFLSRSVGPDWSQIRNDGSPAPISDYDGQTSSPVPVPCLHIPNYALPALGSWMKSDSRVYLEAQEAADCCYENGCFRCANVLCRKTVVSYLDRREQAQSCKFGSSSCDYGHRNKSFGLVLDNALHRPRKLLHKVAEFELLGTSSIKPIIPWKFPARRLEQGHLVPAVARSHYRRKDGPTCMYSDEYNIAGFANFSDAWCDDDFALRLLPGRILIDQGKLTMDNYQHYNGNTR